MRATHRVGFPSWGSMTRVLSSPVEKRSKSTLRITYVSDTACRPFERKIPHAECYPFTLVSRPEDIVSRMFWSNMLKLDWKKPSILTT